MFLTTYEADVAALLNDSQVTFHDLGSDQLYLAKAPKVRIYYLRPAPFSNQHQS
jgi:hypothetical protein